MDFHDIVKVDVNGTWLLQTPSYLDVRVFENVQSSTSLHYEKWHI